ncbi:reticulocyte-binding protein homolog 2a-like isoform X3 [Crassostrea angulata]|uniref:reticulocyte-binding protein homolog 2a-like isoform X3 n=1 Tax=Magallana angulata TaxID=2784310 RepID=UPI0022B1D066|nr:reticulocyte-binding protein homolog 2a-like isoform X3 [Crassostrea angulata]
MSQKGSHNSHERRNSAFVRAVSKVKTINKFRVKRSVSDFGLPKKEEGHLHPLFSSERDRWEKERTELKSKIEELEAFKSKYEEEKQQKERLQRQVDSLSISQSDASQKLVKAGELNERLRQDNKKKTDQIEKYQRDTRFLEDRLRNLEIRASEVEKAELILDTTRLNLESTCVQLRDREHQIRRMESEQEDLNKKLALAQQKISDQEAKIVDLNWQVRHELTRNEGIEKNLEMIPKLKDTIKEKTKEVEALKEEVQDKTALLAVARKSAREYKDQIRAMEHKIEKAEKMEAELEMAQCEVQTLKKLLQGKDQLVIQKSRALDVAKDVIETMNMSTEPEQIDKIVVLLEKMGATSKVSSNGSVCESSSGESDSRNNKIHCTQTKSSRTKDIDVNRNPYSMDENNVKNHRRPLSGGGFLDNVLKDQDSHTRPRTAVVRPVKRSQSYRDALPNKFTLQINGHQRPQSSSDHRHSTEKKTNAKYQPTVDYIIGIQDKTTLSSGSRPRSVSPRSPSWGSTKSRSENSNSLSLQSVNSSDSSDSEDNSTRTVEVLSKLRAKEREEILVRYVDVGDRIVIAVPQKPPRYGRKIAPKPKIYTGIVKYRGPLEQKYNSRIYVGVRLDEPDGDTDGTHKGKRYMYTPSDLGKFFKLIDLTSVLDPKKGKYKVVNSILAHHLEKGEKEMSASG